MTKFLEIISWKKEVYSCFHFKRGDDIAPPMKKWRWIFWDIHSVHAEAKDREGKHFINFILGTSNSAKKRCDKSFDQTKSEKKLGYLSREINRVL